MPRPSQSATGLHPGLVKGAKPRAKKPALLDEAIRRVRALSPSHQERVAKSILADLQRSVDPATKRFQELIKAKYTKGLSAIEIAELGRLEAAFCESDEAFYGPIIERVKGAKRSAGKSRRSTSTHD